MADAHAKHHDYHLVDPSPWPIVGSVAAFILAVGLISWMHKMFAAAPLVFAAGALGVLYTMIGWWRDVIREAEFKGDHTRVVQIRPPFRPLRSSCSSAWCAHVTVVPEVSRISVLSSGR